MQFEVQIDNIINFSQTKFMDELPYISWCILNVIHEYAHTHQEVTRKMRINTYFRYNWQTKVYVNIAMTLLC